MKTKPTLKKVFMRPIRANYKAVLNSNGVLLEYLEEMNLLLDGLYRWCSFLEQAQEEVIITPEDFDEMYITLCKAKLLTWAEVHFDLPELHLMLTGQEVDEAHWLALAKEWNKERGGLWEGEDYE